MASRVKVLALDDDNHSVCFVTTGSYYSNAANFMQECLLKPHATLYEVRQVALCDFDIKDIDVDTFEHWFDLLACTYNPADLFMKDEKLWREREKAFDYFWKYGEAGDFYV